MAKKEIKVTVSEETRNLVQRLHVEYQQKLNVVKGLIEDHQMDVDPEQFFNSSVFQMYEEKTQKCLLAYETAQREMESAYVPEEFKGKSYNWTLDYDTCVMTFSQI